MYTSSLEKYVSTGNTIEQNHYFFGKVPTKITVSEEKRAEILQRFPVPKFQSFDQGIVPSQIITEIQEKRNKTGKDKVTVKDVILLVTDHTIAQTKSKSNYLKVTFTNTHGVFYANMWDRTGSIPQANDFFSKNKVIKISGEAQEFPQNSGKISLTITSYAAVEDAEINPFSLLPKLEDNLEDLTIELISYLEELPEELQKPAFYTLEKYWESFVSFPAAKGHHHAYLGGLLKHTLCLIRLIRYITETDRDQHYKRMHSLVSALQDEFRKEQFNELYSDNPVHYDRMQLSNDGDYLDSLIYNTCKTKKETEEVLKNNFPHKLSRDYLTFAALFHDLPKTFEYIFHNSKNVAPQLFPYASDAKEYDSLSKNNGGFSMHPLFTLMGHIPLSILVLQEAFTVSNTNLPLNEVLDCFHTLLAHHGKLEWGAGATPQTPNGYALHFVDLLDARYEKYISTKKDN